MSVKTFDELLKIVKSDLEKEQNIKGDTIPAVERLSITLNRAEIKKERSKNTVGYTQNAVLTWFVRKMLIRNTDDLQRSAVLRTTPELLFLLKVISMTSSSSIQGGHTSKKWVVGIFPETNKFSSVPTTLLIKNVVYDCAVISCKRPPSSIIFPHLKLTLEIRIVIKYQRSYQNIFLLILVLVMKVSCGILKLLNLMFNNYLLPIIRCSRHQLNLISRRILCWPPTKPALIRCFSFPRCHKNPFKPPLTRKFTFFPIRVIPQNVYFSSHRTYASASLEKLLFNHYICF
ncbi:hypothetical protein QTP88_006821 [Uroleucon formosanum]